MAYSYWLNQIREKLKQNTGSGIIGVFDSGIGGLTVLPSFENSKKQLQIIYLGDTIHFPYGNKTKEDIEVLVMLRITELLNMGCEAIAIACNTASIAFMGICNDEYINSKIIGTISCTADYIFKHKEASRIGIIGTEFTVASGAYEKAIKNRTTSPDIFVKQSAEQTLVWGIENGEDQLIHQESINIVERYKDHKLDTFILGCTHYGHIKDTLSDSFGDKVEVINPSEILGQAIISAVNSGSKSGLQVYFTGERPKLSGKFTKYIPYVLSSKDKMLPFDQLGLISLIKAKSKVLS